VTLCSLVSSSCNHALFTFVESIKYFTKRGSKVHYAFLDASKAFDKVLINGLFGKFLYHFVYILYNRYRNLSCAVVWNRLLGDAFQVRCGVRQGGILSPYLFANYIDDIIVIISIVFYVLPYDVISHDD